MKKIIAFLITLCVVLGCSVTAFAMEYGDKFPNYVNYAGGSYIEVNSSAGQGTLVLPVTYQNNTFSFSGVSGFNVCNITNSTVSGRFILRNGTEYSLRFQSFNTAEIRANSGYNPQWEILTIKNILNTNVIFMDNTDSNRQSDPVFVKYDFTFKEQFYISLAIVSVFLILFTQFIYYMRNRGY